jgi:hypothetical protein
VKVVLLKGRCGRVLEVREWKEGTKISCAFRGRGDIIKCSGGLDKHIDDFCRLCPESHPSESASSSSEVKKEEKQR